MRIKTIHIDGFGKFNNFTLDFREGFNVVYGDNEAGKTTILNFILMMYYGSRTKKKDLSENLRAKYRPWNGSPMKGYIVFNDKGIDYRLERTFNESNSKDVINLYESATGQRIDLPKGEEPGQHILNMSMESFTKTLFIDAEDLIVKGNVSEINNKLYNMISTSDEEISHEATINILEERLYTLKSKSGKKGLIIDLEEKIFQEKTALQLASKNEIEKKSIEQKLQRLEEEIALQRKDDDYSNIVNQIENAKSLNDLNVNRKELESKLSEYEEQRAHKFASLDELRFKEKELESTIEEDSSDFELYTNEKNELMEYKADFESKLYQYNLSTLPKIFIGCAIMALVVAFIFLFTDYDNKYAYISIALAILFAIGAYIQIKLDKKSQQAKIKSKIDKYQIEIEQKNELISDLEIELRANKVRLHDQRININRIEVDLDKLEELYDDKKKNLDQIKESKIFQSLDPRIIESNRMKIVSMKDELDNSKSKYLESYGSYIELDDDEDRFLSLNKEYERLNAYAKERFKNNRYVDEIKAKLTNLQDNLKELQDEYTIIELTIDMLEKSFRQLSNDFNPLLNEKSQEIFSKLTDGNYDRLLVSKDMDLRFEKDNELKEWQFLSSGARDQAYISLKIALAKLITDIDKPMLFLDDIFVNFDQIRTEQGLELLESLDQFDQILLFTCHMNIYQIAKAHKILLDN